MAGRATTPAGFTTFIHHPQGDIKKISVDSGAAAIHPVSLNWTGIFGISPPRSHWKTTPDIGIFQPRLFRQPAFWPEPAHRGPVARLERQPDESLSQQHLLLGRFDQSWHLGDSPQSRLRDWLDPNNLNLQQMDGYPQPVPPAFIVSGNVQTHWGQPLANVKVTITGGASATVYTDAQGNYQFANISEGGSYTIVASRDSNDLGGVSTFDLVLISKHILGLETLDSPWYSAADANKSNSVTTFDIVGIRKLILGIYPAFPNNTSWRFFG